MSCVGQPWKPPPSFAVARRSAAQSGSPRPTDGSAASTAACPAPGMSIATMRGAAKGTARAVVTGVPSPAQSPNTRSARAKPASGEDRKSVEEGKSVSVRVDLGGSLSIKKKKKIYLVARYESVQREKNN